MDDKKFVDTITKIVYSVLQNEKLLSGEWHHGTVKSIISPKMLNIYLDGNSDNLMNVPCNPDVKFNVGDEVFIIFINNNSMDKFVLCRRGV